MEKLTPMMRQYLEIKEQNQDSILFFRLGDFYEMFFDDAIEAARILDITLTGKSCGLDERAPMCGVPYHSAESYIQKLIQNGKKVAICEQVEDPKLVKGIVKREVVKIVTPGTNLDDKTIESHKNIYLMACGYDEANGCSLSYVDISTGEFNSGGFEFEDIIDITAQIAPKEIIFGESFSELLSQDKKLSNQFNQYMNANMIVSSVYVAKEAVLENFFTREYISELSAEKYLSSIELVLAYILDTQKIASRNISKINILKSNQYLKMDLNTRRNLELTENINTKNKRNSLFDVLDHTSTNIGKRMLRKWIEKPLIEESEINFRLDLIDELISKFELREDLKEILSKIYDIERICSKISYESIGTKEIVSLKTSIERLPILIDTVEASQCEKLKQLISGMDNLHDIYLYIDEVILDNPSLSIKDGDVIKSSFSKELEEYRYVEANAAKILQELEMEEKEKTGIKTLKIGYNKVFGYYIEITNSNLKEFELPSDYIRKQTLSNAERFISEKLKNIEDKILTARQKIYEIQSEIYSEFKKELYKNVNRIQSTADKIGELDAALSLSLAAVKGNMVRPVYNRDRIMEIKNSRHPVVEKILGEEYFVPNDIYSDEESRIHIITGPNMGGKSTYMRQIAIVSIMAHIGSFVPASYANIPILDAVYTRVGASDDLSQGQSTFMVEMTEVSYILNNATKDSLVLLDEVGRGTSTFDGLSIAWAILKYISQSIDCTTLFSTHYHEVTELENEFDNIKNYYVSVQEKNDTIIFMRKIFSGKIDKSYGIHVAKLAGVPNKVILDANQKLSQLELKETEVEYEAKLSKVAPKKAKKDEDQISIFDFAPTSESEVEKKLKELDINNITPMQAINLLNELKNLSK